MGVSRFKVDFGLESGAIVSLRKMFKNSEIQKINMGGVNGKGDFNVGNNGIKKGEIFIQIFTGAWPNKENIVEEAEEEERFNFESIYGLVVKI